MLREMGETQIMCNWLESIRESITVTVSTVKEDRKMQAFRRLDAARAEISQYLPSDFDPERDLEEARAERYGSIG